MFAAMRSLRFLFLLLCLAPLPALAQSAAPVEVDFQQLVATKAPPPEYPKSARSQLIQGEVLLRLLVAPSGKVEKAEVVRGVPLLAKAAQQAAKKWKFSPYVRDGKTIEVVTNVPFDFYFTGHAKDAPAPPEETESAAASGPAAANGTPGPLPPHVIKEGTIKGYLLHSVQPVYPEFARQAGIQGSVRLQAIIDQKGRVTSLKLISGPPPLVQSAIGAVQQWRYRPYLLNGEPVEVQTIITVNFQLVR
jgi:TonB family protein